MAIRSVSGFELYNLLQHQKNWPSGGAPAVFDLRTDGSRKRIVRGSFPAQLSGGEVRVTGVAQGSWLGRAICLYDSQPDRLEDHAVAQQLLKDGCSNVLVLSEPFDAFESAYPFLCARETSSKASRRPLCPSCIVPGLLYLGDLTDAAALPRLREQLNVQACVTALAELTPSLKASVAEAKVEHTWCNVRDVEEADIKVHFATAIAKIDAAKQAGTAVFVHCSRGVSRSASLCIAYLMKTEGWPAQRAREAVECCRPIILPNEGFWKCLCEYEKELSGERSGVYAPAPKAKPLDALEFELPPEWASEPTHAKAQLVVEKAGQLVETLAVGVHSMYTFGRSLTCDFPIEHPSASRNHAALVHHQNGGLYVIDLKSSHGTLVNGKPIRPFEACLLREGAMLSFGASSRTHRLEGCPAPSNASAHSFANFVASSGAGAASSSEAAGPMQGPALPGGEPPGGKRKYTPADAKAKKMKRWVDGPKSHAKMSENERVARGAGAGSGCFGTG